MQTHFFDHNATTPLAPEVAETYASALREVFGNASSIHAAGQAARQHLERSRRIIAASLQCQPAELVFTSGGTESNNLALLGFVRNLPPGPKHVITTTIEHPSVLEPCRQLEREGVHVSYIAPDRSGIVSPERIQRELRPETALVSVMHANNETGTIQPLSQISELLRRHHAVFHSDGLQAVGKIPVDLHALGVGLYSMSAHKLFAPKGVGALFVRKGTPLRGIQLGGHHERERRSGTENVPGIMAFAKAMELSAMPDRVDLLRDRFEDQVLGSLADVERNGDPHRRLPNTSNLLFREVSGESLVISLDMKGMAVSTGSACSSGSVEPSHVLLAMGRTMAEARFSVRFSFGRYNTAAEVDALAAAVIASVHQLRKSVRKEAQLVTA